VDAVELMSTHRKFWRDENGATAVEFVLVLPFCVFLVVGAITMSIALYATETMHSSVEAAARYASTYTALNGSNPTSTTVRTYVSSRYKGPAKVTWTYYYPAQTGNTCASVLMHQVKGSASYRVITGVGNVTFPMNASACFP
jgi:Flp pilus assembly protein TadG